MGKVLKHSPPDRRYSPDAFADLALALGYLAMDWAGLDASLDEIIEACLSIGEDQQSCLAAVLPGIEQRCQLLVRLAHFHPPSDEWKSDVIDIAGKLQGEMTSARNRFIHDGWALNGPQFYKIDKRAFIKKGQSRQEPQLYSRRISTVLLDDIWKLIELVDSVSNDLFWLGHEVRSWRLNKKPPALRARLSLPKTHSRPSKALTVGLKPWTPPQRLPMWEDK